MPIEKIIVLEDDLVVRKNLEQQLRYKRYDVASASTIAEAQELLTKDNFDLMVVDVRLPDGKGTDLLKQLQTRPVKPLVVMISGMGTVAGYNGVRRPSPNSPMAGMSTSEDRSPPPTMRADER